MWSVASLMRHMTQVVSCELQRSLQTNNERQSVFLCDVRCCYFVMSCRLCCGRVFFDSSRRHLTSTQTSPISPSDASDHTSHPSPIIRWDEKKTNYILIIVILYKENAVPSPSHIKQLLLVAINHFKTSNFNSITELNR